MSLKSGAFEVVAMLLWTEYFLYNNKDATDGTAINPKYNVNHTAVCAFSL